LPFARKRTFDRVGSSQLLVSRSRLLEIAVGRRMVRSSSGDSTLMASPVAITCAL